MSPSPPPNVNGTSIKKKCHSTLVRIGQELDDFFKKTKQNKIKQNKNMQVLISSRGDRGRLQHFLPNWS